MTDEDPLRVLIVDDEELARLRLRTLLEQTESPRVRVVGEAASVMAALQLLDRQACDLLLLDIRMPGPDGRQLAAELGRLESPPAIVFVTAHAEHALEAFDLSAADYLTKPVRRERLRTALQRVAARRVAAAATVDPGPDVPVIVVSDRGRIVRVPVADVLYLKAELKYVTLRTALHTHVLDDSLAELESRLGEGFLRVHRNALVALRAVRALERRMLADAEGEEAGETWAVQVAPVGEWLAVSRRQVGAVREALTAAGP